MRKKAFGDAIREVGQAAPRRAGAGGAELHAGGVLHGAEPGQRAARARDGALRSAAARDVERDAAAPHSGRGACPARGREGKAHHD